MTSKLVTEESWDNQLQAIIKDAYKNGKYSDLIITCGEDTYNVHKVVVCSRSDFFARCIKFGGKETEDGIINLPEDDPTAVKYLIQYLYENEYDPVLPQLPWDAPTFLPLPGHLGNTSDESSHHNFPHPCSPFGFGCNEELVCYNHRCGHVQELDWIWGDYMCKDCKAFVKAQLTGPPEQLIIHAKMYEIGDKYQLDGLKKLAKEKFRRGCKLFHEHSCFPAAVEMVFENTPEEDLGLRDIVSETISTYSSIVKRPDMLALMTKYNGLAFGILRQKAKENGWFPQ